MPPATATFRHAFAATAFFCLAPLGLTQEKAGPPTPQARIEQVLAAQAEAWNAGDIERFMDGYARTANLRFASGGTVTRGWQETLDRYKQRYPDRAAMGTLTFSELETTVFPPDGAVVFGHWRLKTDKGEPHGLFTLVFRRTEAGWRIVADHTSAAPALD